jgi:hypothetical protein
VRVCEQIPFGADPPFEVHMIRFPERAAFDSYRQDEELKSLAEDRAVAIRHVTIWTGSDVCVYNSILLQSGEFRALSDETL